MTSTKSKANAGLLIFMSKAARNSHGFFRVICVRLFFVSLILSAKTKDEKYEELLSCS
jgi:hypothetical protein